MNEIGTAGEKFVAGLLRRKGYTIRELGGTYPVIDIEVTARTPFRVSVKTSNSKRHVRMGPEKSVAQILDSDFVFGLMPTAGKATLDLRPDGYDLLIVPGATARTDSLHVHHSYLAVPSSSGAARSASAGVIVKEYSGRMEQKEVWTRWQQFKEAWHLLPPPI